MCMTAIAIWKVDSWGRKPLLLIGSLGMLTALSCIGVWFRYNEEKQAPAYLLVLCMLPSTPLGGCG